MDKKLISATTKKHWRNILTLNIRHKPERWLNINDMIDLLKMTHSCLMALFDAGEMGASANFLSVK
jgi:hypothetical protein